MLLLAILVLICVVVILYLRSLFPVISQSFDEVYELAQTGDIIYFIHEHSYSFFKYIRPFMSHVAMVVVSPKTNEKYVIEIHAKGDKKCLGVNKKSGIHIYPLKWRIKRYLGCVYLAKLNYKLSIENIKQFINNIKDYQNNIPFDESFKITGCKKLLFGVNINKDHKMFCTEFVGFCLQKLSVIQNYHHITLPIDFLFLQDSRSKKLYTQFYKIDETLHNYINS